MTGIGCSVIPGVGAVRRRGGAQDDGFLNRRRKDHRRLVVRASRLHRTPPRRRNSETAASPRFWVDRFWGDQFWRDRLAPPLSITRLVLFIVFVLITAAPLPAASPNLPSISFGESKDSAEIVRCHFNENRLVIRHAEKLHVLRKGDTLENTGLRVVEITSEAATLAIRQGSPAGGIRIIRIIDTGHGALLLREYATDPSALASGSAATAPRAASSAESQQKTTAPDGD